MAIDLSEPYHAFRSRANLVPTVDILHALLISHHSLSSGCCIVKWLARRTTCPKNPGNDSVGREWRLNSKTDFRRVSIRWLMYPWKITLQRGHVFGIPDNFIRLEKVCESVEKRKIGGTLKTCMPTYPLQLDLHWKPIILLLQLLL